MVLDYIEYAKQVVLDRQYLSLFTATIVLFSASFIAWFIYSKQLAKRDLFELPKVKAERKISNFLNKIVYFLKYLLIFPAYSFIWFLIFSFLLFLLSKSRSIQDIFYFGIVVVAATRVGAYVSERLAEDMAKLLPWSLILIFLIDPAAVTLNGAVESFTIFMQHVPEVARYLLFIIFIEWILRIGRWIIKPKEA